MSDYDPFKVQVGGNHYAKYAIQPMEYIEKNGLPFADGCVVKYITRWRDKGGIEDLRKAKHFIEMLIAIEERKEQEKESAIKLKWQEEKMKLIKEMQTKGEQNYRVQYNPVMNTTSVMEITDNKFGTDVIFTGKLYDNEE